MSEEHPSRSGVKSVEVAYRLVNAIAESGRPLALRAIATAAAMSPSKAHRYLVSLMRVGFVSQDEGSRHYVLGPAALRIGLAAGRQSDNLQRALCLQRRVRDTVAETVILCVWGSHGPTILHIEESDQPVQLTMKIGTVLPIATTAAGRVFAAHLPTDTVRRALSRQLGDGTPCSDQKSAWNRLEEIATRVRRDGLATSIDEYAPGVSTLAVPLVDSDGGFIASLAVIGRTGNIDTRPDGRLATPLQEVRREFQAMASADDGVPAPDRRVASMPR